MYCSVQFNFICSTVGKDTHIWRGIFQDLHATEESWPNTGWKKVKKGNIFYPIAKYQAIYVL